MLKEEKKSVLPKNEPPDRLYSLKYSALNANTYEKW